MKKDEIETIVANEKKDEIKTIVAKKLVDEKLFDEYDFSHNKNDGDKVEIRKLELQYELELKKL